MISWPSQLSNTCCNPFDQHNHSSKRKNLRQVTKWMCERAPYMSIGSNICDNCRKKLAKIPTTPQVSSASELQSESDSESLASLNQCLGGIGETSHLVPRPQPAFCHYQYGKAGRAWYLFSCEHEVIGKWCKIC